MVLPVAFLYHEEKILTTLIVFITCAGMVMGCTQKSQTNADQIDTQQRVCVQKGDMKTENNEQAADEEVIKEMIIGQRMADGNVSRRLLLFLQDCPETICIKKYS